MVELELLNRAADPERFRLKSMEFYENITNENVFVVRFTHIHMVCILHCHYLLLLCIVPCGSVSCSFDNSTHSMGMILTNHFYSIHLKQLQHWSPVVPAPNQWDSLKNSRMKTHNHIPHDMCYALPIFTFVPHRVFSVCFVFVRSSAAGFGHCLKWTFSIDCEFVCRFFVLVRTQLGYMMINKSIYWKLIFTINPYILGIP